MTARPSILYLDDEADNLASFKAVFRRHYNVHTALTREHALEVLSQHPIQLVLSDQRMPQCTGVAFLEEVKELDAAIIRILITGYTDVQTAIEAINRGKVYHYISKPWNVEELKVILDNALETYALRRDKQQLEMENQALTIQNLQREREHLNARFEVLKAQVNPHFLFNSLNTLASLIATDAPMAITFTTRFAKLYRSFLELGEQQLIPLHKELELVDAYINLQRMRFGHFIFLEKHLENTAFVLPPFAIQILVENAVKHNVVTPEQHLRITLSIWRNEQLMVRNNLQLRKHTGHSTGIGLRNLEQRYMALTGYSIRVEQEQDFFTVILPLIHES